jgi:hypothetical protein
MHQWRRRPRSPRDRRIPLPAAFPPHRQRQTTSWRITWTTIRNGTTSPSPPQRWARSLWTTAATRGTGRGRGTPRRTIRFRTTRRSRRSVDGSTQGPSGGSSPLRSTLGRPPARFRRPLLAVGGQGATASGFRTALRWFHGALEEGLRTPLAPRLVFPDPGTAGSAFALMDASRDWRIGGWTLLATTPLTFLLIAAPYPPDLVAGARDTGAAGISTGALELAAYHIMAEAVIAHTGCSAHC